MGMERVARDGRTDASPPAAGAMSGARVQAAALALVLAISAAILVQFHDRHWLPRDDGYYAHIGQRILAGEVLHRDVQGLHSGYVYFASALALKLFGEAMVSLRYPLVLLGIVQAGLIFALLRPRGLGIAATAAFALTSLSFVQFPDPTAHWYVQFLFILLVCVLAWRPQGARLRLETVGLILAVLLLFRQLTGAIVAIGVLSYLLVEAGAVSRPSPGGRHLARGLFVVMAAGLAGYLYQKSNPLGWLLAGVWPLALLVWGGLKVTADNRVVLVLLLRLAAGGAIGAAPLVLYHVATGSLGAWYHDVVTSALALTGFSYFNDRTYGVYLLLPLLRLGEAAGVAGLLNALFWPVLTLLPVALGVVMLRRCLSGARLAGAPDALPYLAVFYGVVSLHFQDAAYLFFMIGTTIAGLLWLAARTRWRHAAVALAGVLSAIGLYFHAGQPYARGVLGQLAGERQAQVASEKLERLGLRIEAADRALYEGVVDLIRRTVSPAEPILAIPAGPEFHFLSGRRNALPYSYASFGVIDDATLASALESLERDPPRLVIHVPHLPYNTPFTDRIMAFVAERYDRLEDSGPFRLYRRRD